jgi:hypothetical protein
LLVEIVESIEDIAEEKPLLLTLDHPTRLLDVVAPLPRT